MDTMKEVADLNKLKAQNDEKPYRERINFKPLEEFWRKFCKTKKYGKFTEFQLRADLKTFS